MPILKVARTIDDQKIFTLPISQRGPDTALCIGILFRKIPTWRYDSSVPLPQNFFWFPHLAGSRIFSTVAHYFTSSNPALELSPIFPKSPLLASSLNALWCTSQKTRNWNFCVCQGMIHPRIDTMCSKPMINHQSIIRFLRHRSLVNSQTQVANELKLPFQSANAE